MPVETNGDPECVEANSEPVPVITVETNGDPKSTNGEREPEPVCAGVSRGGETGDELGGSI